MATAFLETFETDGNTLTGGTRYTTSIAESVTGTDNYFIRTDDTGANAIDGSFTSTDDTWFAVGDFDGSGNTTASATIEFTGIDISGLTDLNFSGLFAEENTSDAWDPDSLVFVEVSIDGGAFTKVLQFAADRSNGSNHPAALDSDLDGVGEGTVLTSDFATFAAAIAGTGSSLDLRVTFENLTQSGEDIQIDNLSITGTRLAPVAVDDAFTITESELAIGELRANDTDDQNDPITIIEGAGEAVLTAVNVVSVGGREGSAFFGATGDLTFAFSTDGNFDDLDAGETDTVTLNYTISDGTGATDSATVTVTIEGEANSIAGDEMDNSIRGTDGDDMLEGNGGNDVLNGGLGADTMDGGEGDDIYFVDNIGDVIIEAAGEGYDRVSTSISYTLTENVEMGTATGTADIDLTGNAENNWLNGNSGANALNGLVGNDRLQGRDGDDVLNGGTGNDNLYGNAGTDTFVFADGDGSDVIRDFETGETIDLSGTSAAAFGDLELTDLSSGALVDYGTGSIVLSGLGVSDLSADDFLF